LSKPRNVHILFLGVGTRHFVPGVGTRKDSSNTLGLLTIAASGSVSVAHAAFEQAVKDWPQEHFTLRQGMVLIREHPQKNNASAKTVPSKF
jgi:hypothetical protein